MISAKWAILFLIFSASVSGAQDQDYRDQQNSPADLRSAAAKSRDDSQALSTDDRLSIVAAALDSRIRSSERDCSHLVHAIYEDAGFAYPYAPSSEIYAGAEGFERVKHPQAGDLIVWRGHVGIIIKPSEHIFFSFLRSGPGTDDYESPYWKHRGRPRFYRFVKTSFCTECDHRRSSSHRLVNINR